MTNILYFYYNEHDCQEVSILKSVLQECHFDMTNSLIKAKELYKQNPYHIVMVDFTLDKGRDFLQFMAKDEPSQRIITMSNNLECSALQGCEYCMHTHKRKRIFKPLNLKELTHMITHYDQLICNYMHKFNNIIQILDDLINTNYNHFLYEKERQLIYPKESYSESLIIEELVHITELLQENSIAYSVDENYTIKLLSEE